VIQNKRLEKVICKQKTDNNKIHSYTPMISQKIPNYLLSELGQFVSSKTGLFFPEKKWPEFKRGIKSAALDLGFEDPMLYIHSLLSSSYTKKQLNILIDHLTVGETFFFRDKNLFQVLKDHILQRLIKSRHEEGKNIRIWSAGCCSGEEPYSIAMLIDQIIPEIQDWKISLAASDINEKFLQKAKNGLYSSWSFRNVPIPIVEKYFQNMDKNHFKISAHLKNMVRFYQLNLVEKEYPLLLSKDQDIIFCRNVLMYFTPLLRAQVIRSLINSLAEGGWLIVSPVEAAFIQEPDLKLVQFSGSFLFQKEFTWKENSRTIPFFFPTTPPSSAYADKRTNSERNSQSFKQDIYQEALVFFKKGFYEESAQKLSSLLSSSQNHNEIFLLKAEAMALLAKSFANLGKLDEARKWSEQAIYNEKLNPAYYYLHAGICQEQGHIKESIKFHKQALYLDPEFVLAHFALGNLFMQEGRHRKSKKHLHNALSLLLSINSKDVLPYSDGITVEVFIKIVKSMTNKDRNV